MPIGRVAKVTVSAIPMTPVGKIRRKRLADLVSDPPDEVSSPTPVRDPLSLVRACAARTDLIAPDTTVHDYGFNSAAAIRFSLELDRDTGRSLPTGVAFDHLPLALANHLLADQPGREDGLGVAGLRRVPAG